jgi:hypothetical protein
MRKLPQTSWKWRTLQKQLQIFRLRSLRRPALKMTRCQELGVNRCRPGTLRGVRPSGADFGGLMYGLKPVPFEAGSTRAGHRRCRSLEEQPQMLCYAQHDSRIEIEWA